MIFIIQFVDSVDINMWILTYPGILTYSGILGINSTWLWWIILLMHFWIHLLIFCWGFLHLCLSVTLTCSFLFLLYICLVWYHVLVFSFIDIFYCFLISISFISALIFMNYFLLLTEFCLFSFSSSFRCTVRLFKIFLFSWSRLVLLQTSPLKHPPDFGLLCFHFHFLQVF